MTLESLKPKIDEFLIGDKMLNDETLVIYGNLALSEIIHLTKPITLIYPMSEIKNVAFGFPIDDYYFVKRHDELELNTEIELPSELENAFCFLLCAKASLNNPKGFQGRAFREMNKYREIMHNEFLRNKKEVWI